MATKVAKLTVSLPQELLAIADEIAQERKVSRSKLVSLCLQELAEKRLRHKMTEGYKTMATENLKFANNAFGLSNEVITDWE